MDLLDSVARYLEKRETLRDVVISVLVVVAVLALRTAALRSVRRARRMRERVQLRWTVQVKLGSLAIIAVALVIIWAAEVKEAWLSVAAIAVAAVIATKEVLLCILGSVLRASSGSFHVGDRIEIAGVRGDVIDYGLLATTILEIGSSHKWTGRALTVPNSLLLTQPVINETFTEAYVLHIIRVPLAEDDDWQQAEKALVRAGEEVCAEYLQKAKRYMDAQAREHGLEAPSVEPYVSVQLPEAGTIHLLLRLPTPAHQKGETEQRVLRRFLAGRKKKAAVPPA